MPVAELQELRGKILLSSCFEGYYSEPVWVGLLFDFDHESAFEMDAHEVVVIFAVSGHLKSLAALYWRRGER